MNRLLALVAVGSLGSGCIASDTCDAHTVWISWPSFTRATSTGYETVDYTCYEDFDRMDVWVGGVYAPARCDEGAVAYNLLTGTYDVRVEAVGIDDVPIVREVRQVSISDTCADQEAAMSPGEAWVNLDYALPGNVCDAGFSDSSSFMWFSVFDEIWGDTIAELSNASPIASWTAATCSVANGTWLVLPEGTFTLDWIQERIRATESVDDISDVPVSSSNCTPRTFSTVSGVDERVAVTLAAGDCP